jgi:hypothetical protein
MPTYQYVARARLRVGNDWREYGSPVPEAGSWANVDAYVNSGQLERIPIADDQERSTAVQQQPRPSRQLIPDDYDQRVPTPIGEGERFPGDDQQDALCVNCGNLNYLSLELPDTSRWTCWRCHQGQTLSEANQRSAQLGADEHAHAIAAAGER